MKKIYLLLLLGLLFANCKDKSISSTDMSQILVVRQAQTTPATPKKELPTIAPQIEKQETIHPYHIIVASYAISEKSKAERSVQQLKAENHPATLLFSAKRYRVSIANFATEKESNEALPKYRNITKREDIWIHKEAPTK